MSAQPLDAAGFGKLRWRCRRGLLENDILIERFFARRSAEQGVTQDDANGLTLLMQLSDPELLDLFLGRRAPDAQLDRPEVHRVLDAIRSRPGADRRHA